MIVATIVAAWLAIQLPLAVVVGRTLAHVSDAQAAYALTNIHPTR